MLADDRIYGVNGVAIWTDNLDAMTAFYVEVLGLPPRSRTPRYTNFAWGNFRLSLGLHSEVRGRAREPLRVMVNLDVRDIHAVHRRLAAAGVRFLRPPEPESWGGWVATLEDPDGNLLQLLQPAEASG